MVIADDDPGGDWTEPGVFRCASGVHRIPLPLPQDGLRAVNVYAVDDGEGVTLIDAGWAIPEARQLLKAALAELDLGFADVRRFLVTHLHRDHYTQAAALRTEFGTRVALGRGEEPGLRVINEAPETERERGMARLRRAGADELVRAFADAPPPPAHDLAVWTLPDDWVADGDRIEVGERTLTAVETPGHTRGHVVFADGPGDVMFCGDHVLPRITPSIALEPDPPVSPLADYLTSLKLIREHPDAALLAAHGPVGMRVHERVDQLLAHHGARLDATLAGLAEGRSTAWEVAGALRWTRREHRLRELDLFNAMLATLETAAHLQVLVERGRVTATEQDGVIHYLPS